ncbi:hypothetical protein CERZMDRAFT_80324 [Cercospora zeae-maydis SCOH1-5]|uniref:C2H2-type domain-containing protein n=1 Tax=Cercospora zeae-maydis SCOH1-5 TaxID=717836 RepID=A0A6A6FW32_9PEZI|nr:hypothetical protein CERZMDRAFT_80324 [Cercospora zeae-maydis SCOH1-5]
MYNVHRVHQERVSSLAQEKGSSSWLLSFPCCSEKSPTTINVDVLSYRFHFLPGSNTPDKATVVYRNNIPARYVESHNTVGRASETRAFLGDLTVRQKHRAAARARQYKVITELAQGRRACHATEIRAWHAFRVRSDVRSTALCCALGKAGDDICPAQRTRRSPTSSSALSCAANILSPSATIDNARFCPGDPVVHCVTRSTSTTHHNRDVPECALMDPGWNHAARYHGLPTMSTVQQDPRIRQHSPLQQPLTLSPQLLFLGRPETSGTTAQQSKSQDAKPVRWEHSSYDQMRRQSVASNVSSRSSMSRRQDGGSSTNCSMESRGSPASSLGESTSSVSSHIADLSEMSAAPFCSSLTGIFGLTTECLACGYRYDSVHELADHQRMVHGMADVIF